MDFMKWLNSLDEFLYELASWLLFVPLTFWRVMVRPLAMMDYAEGQLERSDAEQYEDGIKPPLFLVMTLLIAHGVSMALGNVDRLVGRQDGLAALVKDESTALVLRLVMFASFALFAAARSARRRKQPLTRSSLRSPFYAQCYPTAVFALGLGIGADLMDTLQPVPAVCGLVLWIVTIIHYGTVETRWFASKLHVGYGRALGMTSLGLLEGSAVVAVVAFLFSS